MARRPWYKIHLSTAIILMFVASGLLWLNFARYLHPLGPKIHYEGPLKNCKLSDATGFFYMGLPIPAIGYRYHLEPTTDTHTFIMRETDKTLICKPLWLLVDILVAAGILVLVAIACEWSIRRKERRKQGGGK